MRLPKNQAQQQIKDRIARFSQDPPRPPGPWPFIVYDTIVTEEDVGVLSDATPADVGKDLGLQVRTTPVKTEQPQQVGSAASWSVV